MSIVNRDSPFLTLPREVRRQILIEALLSEIALRTPHPFGYRVLPFDKPVHAVLPPDDVRTMERKWRQSAFWGKEPMTRLMRVNKQLYEEVYSILWTEFAIGPFRYMDSTHQDEWRCWLATHNPRAVPLIRHLHLRVSDLTHSWFYAGDVLLKEPGKGLDVDTSRMVHLVRSQIDSYPGLVSIRFQVAVGCTARSTSEAIRTALIERWMRIIASCGDLRVMLFWEPNNDVSWAADCIRECQERIGQAERMPFLHRQFLGSFPPTLKGDYYSPPYYASFR